METDFDALENLERAVCEIDALEAIYGSIRIDADGDALDRDENDGDEGCRFAVISRSALDHARSLLESGEEVSLGAIPELEVEIRLCQPQSSTTQVSHGTSRGKTSWCSLRCRLPPGYPDVSSIPSLSVVGFSRSVEASLTAGLNKVAQTQVGQEAVLALVEDFKERLSSYWEQLATDTEASTQNNVTAQTEQSGFSRRWIWVHHITNGDRRKTILKEARSLKLSGYLKSGYPGVVVVEGPIGPCEEFVTWVKGNKSRPGGFGRNWGHHVRGHIDFGESTERCFVDESFTELEDLAELGKRCKISGLENEFLEYVMQHKANNPKEK